MATRRTPAVRGRNVTSTLQVVFVVPLAQVVPPRRVKSRLGVPNVNACTLPTVVAELMVKGKVRDVPDEASTCNCPNPTADAISSTTRLLEVSATKTSPEASTATACGVLRVRLSIVATDPAPPELTCTTRLLPASAM